MWWIKRQEAHADALRPSIAVGLIFSLLAATIGGGLGSASIVESLAYGVVYSFAIFAATMIGGRRALLLLWALMIALWAAFLQDSVAAGRWRSAEAARLIIAPFQLWSLYGLPLAVGTAMFVGISHRRRRSLRFSVVGAGIWLCLIAIYGYFGRLPPDVGAYPRYGSATLIFLGIMTTIWPFIISVFCIHYIRSDQQSGSRWPERVLFSPRR